MTHEQGYLSDVTPKWPDIKPKCMHTQTRAYIKNKTKQNMFLDMQKMRGLIEKKKSDETLFKLDTVTSSKGNVLSQLECKLIQTE